MILNLENELYLIVEKISFDQITKEKLFNLFQWTLMIKYFFINYERAQLILATFS